MAPISAANNRTDTASNATMYCEKMASDTCAVDWGSSMTSRLSSKLSIRAIAITENSSTATTAAIPRFSAPTDSSSPSEARVNITPNRNSTTTAPM